MNIHVYVLFVTFVMYLVLRNYKKKLLNDKDTQSKKSSNMLYLMIVPIAIYGYDFLTNTSDVHPIDSIMDSKSVELLKKPYPDISSIDISGTSS